MIFIDFECHVSGKYRLGKKSVFTTEDFIRDPHFQPTLLAVAENGGPPQSAAGPDAIDELLTSIDWPRKAAAAQMLDIARRKHHRLYVGCGQFVLGWNPTR